MADSATLEPLLTALREGDEPLDRGMRGPAIELDLLRQAGLIRAPLPMMNGGQGWGTSPDGALPLLGLLKALGGASLPVARIYEGHVNAVRLIVDHGSPDQRRRMAALVNEGAIAGVWGADTEMPVRLAASKLSGTKAFASGLGDLAFAVITAQTDAGLQMVIADVTEQRRFDHVSWDVTGMRGSRSGRFDCDGVSAPRNALLGPPDALFAEPQFHGGIWRIIACYAGAMETLATELHIAVQLKGVSNDPLASHRFGQAIVESRTVNALAHQACVAAESVTGSQAAVADILFAREAVEQAAIRQFEIVERMAGTSLHQTESRMGRIIRNLRFYLRQAQLDGKLALATSIWRAENQC